MKNSRFALTLVAIAVCRLASAQGTDARPVNAAPDTSAAPAAVAPSVSAPPNGTVQPQAANAVANVQSAAANVPSAAASASQESTAQPRIIQGNDKVIAPPQAAPVLTGSSNSFRFEEAPILDVIHVVLRDILKVDYMVHPPISGTVTLATNAEVTADQAAYLLEGALLANGLVMARDSRGTYHVGRPESLRGIVSAPRQAGSGPLAPGYGAVIIPLQYIGAAEMATILRPLLPPDALIRVDTARNLLVLAGNRTQAEGWLSIVSTFDVDLLKGMSVGVFPLKYASVREVELALRAISGGRAGGQGAASAAPAVSGQAAGAGAAAGAASVEAVSALGDNPFLGALRIMPIERLNSILVVTPRAAYLEEAKRWIERLDKPGLNLAEQTLFVYQVQNGSARHLAEVLNGIYGSGETRSTSATSGVAPGLNAATGSTALGMTTGGSLFGSQGGGGFAGAMQAGQSLGASQIASQSTPATALKLGNVRVVADEANNSVLVYGTAAEFAKIESTLKRLDLPATQVLIEATIVEVTLNDDFQYGLQWTFSNALSNGKTGTATLLNSQTAQSGGALGGALAGFSYTLRNSVGSVRAVLSALAEKSLVKVISSPSLMVLDNHTAQIIVGNQQPIQSAETFTSGGNVSTSIQYKDTGVALSVTPSVNAGNMVTMTINQAVTDVGDIDEATKQRAFLQRQINSKVAVRSGEALVLGGLIRDNSTNQSSGIPLLHEIPVFGALFGTKTKKGERTELLVVITPRVVRSDQEARDVSNEMRDRMRSFADYPPFGRFSPMTAPVIPVPNGPYQPSGPNVP